MFEFTNFQFPNFDCINALLKFRKNHEKIYFQKLKIDSAFPLSSNDGVLMSFNFLQMGCTD